MGDTEKTEDLRKDPLPAFCFMVKISAKGLEGEAFFKSVGGLKSETEVVDFRAGGVNHSTYRLVGATKWPNLVLKRGFSGSEAMTQWRNTWLMAGVVDTKVERATITITQLDTRLQPKFEWVFQEGWPCKWELSELDAAKNEIAIETLEIAHHGLVSSQAK